MISQDQNMTAALNRFKTVVSNTSGATRNAGGTAQDEVGFRQSAKFSAFTPGAITPQDKTLPFRTGRGEDDLALIERMLRGEAAMDAAEAMSRRAQASFSRGGAIGQAMLGQAQGAGLVGGMQQQSGQFGGQNIPGVKPPVGVTPSGAQPQTGAVDSASVKTMYVTSLVVQGRFAGMSTQAVQSMVPTAPQDINVYTEVDPALAQSLQADREAGGGPQANEALRQQEQAGINDVPAEGAVGQEFIENQPGVETRETQPQPKTIETREKTTQTTERVIEGARVTETTERVIERQVPAGQKQQPKTETERRQTPLDKDAKAGGGPKGNEGFRDVAPEITVETPESDEDLFPKRDVIKPIPVEEIFPEVNVDVTTPQPTEPRSRDAKQQRGGEQPQPQQRKPVLTNRERIERERQINTTRAEISRLQKLMQQQERTTKIYPTMENESILEQFREQISDKEKSLIKMVRDTPGEREKQIHITRNEIEQLTKELSDQQRVTETNDTVDNRQRTEKLQTRLDEKKNFFNTLVREVRGEKQDRKETPLDRNLAAGDGEGNQTYTESTTTVPSEKLAEQQREIKERMEALEVRRNELTKQLPATDTTETIKTLDERREQLIKQLPSTDTEKTVKTLDTRREQLVKQMVPADVIEKQLKDIERQRSQLVSQVVSKETIDSKRQQASTSDATTRQKIESDIRRIEQRNNQINSQLVKIDERKSKVEETRATSEANRVEITKIDQQKQQIQATQQNSESIRAEIAKIDEQKQKIAQQSSNSDKAREEVTRIDKERQELQRQLVALQSTETNTTTQRTLREDRTAGDGVDNKTFNASIPAVMPTPIADETAIREAENKIQQINEKQSKMSRTLYTEESIAASRQEAGKLSEKADRYTARADKLDAERTPTWIKALSYVLLTKEERDDSNAFKQDEMADRDVPFLRGQAGGLRDVVSKTTDAINKAETHNAKTTAEINTLEIEKKRIQEQLEQAKSHRDAESAARGGSREQYEKANYEKYVLEERQKFEKNQQETVRQANNFNVQSSTAAKELVKIDQERETIKTTLAGDKNTAQREKSLAALATREQKVLEPLPVDIQHNAKTQANILRESQKIEKLIERSQQIQNLKANLPSLGQSAREKVTFLEQQQSSEVSSLTKEEKEELDRRSQMTKSERSELVKEKLSETIAQPNPPTEFKPKEEKEFREQFRQNEAYNQALAAAFAQTNPSLIKFDDKGVPVMKDGRIETTRKLSSEETATVESRQKDILIQEQKDAENFKKSQDRAAVEALGYSFDQDSTAGTVNADKIKKLEQEKANAAAIQQQIADQEKVVAAKQVEHQKALDERNAARKALKNEGFATTFGDMLTPGEGYNDKKFREAGEKMKTTLDSLNEDSVKLFEMKEKHKESRSVEDINKEIEQLRKQSDEERISKVGSRLEQENVLYTQTVEQNKADFEKAKAEREAKDANDNETAGAVVQEIVKLESAKGFNPKKDEQIAAQSKEMLDKLSPEAKGVAEQQLSVHRESKQYEDVIAREKKIEMLSMNKSSLDEKGLSRLRVLQIEQDKAKASLDPKEFERLKGMTKQEREADYAQRMEDAKIKTTEPLFEPEVPEKETFIREHRHKEAFNKALVETFGKTDPSIFKKDEKTGAVSVKEGSIELNRELNEKEKQIVIERQQALLAQQKKDEDAFKAQQGKEQLTALGYLPKDQKAAAAAPGQQPTNQQGHPLPIPGTEPPKTSVNLTVAQGDQKQQTQQQTQFNTVGGRPMTATAQAGPGQTVTYTIPSITVQVKFENLNSLEGIIQKAIVNEINKHGKIQAGFGQADRNNRG